MKQQSQVNSGDVKPKVVQVMRLRRKRKVKLMIFEFFRKTEGEMKIRGELKLRLRRSRAK
jgi:hypothetical protein